MVAVVSLGCDVSSVCDGALTVAIGAVPLPSGCVSLFELPPQPASHNAVPA